jgi:hypothetical protein
MVFFFSVLTAEIDFFQLIQFGADDNLAIRGVGVFFEIILMVIFGLVKFGECCDFSDDRFLVESEGFLSGPFRDLLLRVIVVKND